MGTAIVRGYRSNAQWGYYVRRLPARVDCCSPVSSTITTTHIHINAATSNGASPCLCNPLSRQRHCTIVCVATRNSFWWLEQPWPRLIMQSSNTTMAHIMVIVLNKVVIALVPVPPQAMLSYRFDVQSPATWRCTTVHHCCVAVNSSNHPNRVVVSFVAALNRADESAGAIAVAASSVVARTAPTCGMVDDQGRLWPLTAPLLIVSYWCSLSTRRIW